MVLGGLFGVMFLFLDCDLRVERGEKGYINYVKNYDINENKVVVI